jgi:hypothetical protein
MADFQALQTRFTAWLRDPERVPPPLGIEARRLQVYRDLFYNNVEDFLANAFPVLRKITAEMDWHAMVRDFYARHTCQDPLFRGVAEEFLRYLEHERGAVAGDWPFLAELAHYEWVELALSIAEPELSAVAAEADGDLLEAVPVLSPLAWPLIYAWPVHRLGPDFLPGTPPEQPTCLVVYRNREDEVKFTEVNLLTARLLQGMQADPQASGRVLLTQLAAELGADPETLIAGGLAMMQGLQQRDVLLGTRPAT